MNRQQLSPNDYLEYFPAALRLLRQRSGKRQYAVAEEARITKAMLSAYETGKQAPSFKTLLHVLAALGADLGTFENAIFIVKGLNPPVRMPLPAPLIPVASPSAESAEMVGSGIVQVGGVIRIELSMPVPSSRSPEKA